MHLSPHEECLFANSLRGASVGSRVRLAAAHPLLPDAAQGYGDRLPVHTPCGVAAEERDHLCDLKRLKHPLLGIDGSALTPYLLDARPTPFGLRLGRALGHCGSNPTGQHRVGSDSERAGVLCDRTCEPDNSMLGSGVGTAGALRLLAGGRAGKYQSPEPTFTHAADREACELKRTVEVDTHRLAPDLRILLPHETLVGRTDAVIHDQHFNRTQSPLALGAGQAAAFGSTQIGYYVVEANSLKLGRAAGHRHHARSRHRQ